MHTDDLRGLVERHREQLLKAMEECELERARLQNELADMARQGTGFEVMRPSHDRIADVARDYWQAHGRVTLIDQLMEALAGQRDRLTLDDAEDPVLAAADGAGPWARCAEETCPPYPPWA